MVWATKEKFVTWTDESLGQAIHSFKEQQDFSGLVRFLELRLADDAPCCVSNRARFWNELGLTQVQEDPKLSETCFENALSIDPDYIVAQYNLATLAMENGNLDGALKLYHAILAEEPGHFNALFNAGICHTNANDNESALPLFMKAAKLRPEDGHLQFLTSETLLQTGRAKEALPFFRSAQKQNHGHFETTMGLAISLLETQGYDEAIIICEQALMTFGPAMLPLQIKGDALLAINRIEKAVQCHIEDRKSVV